MSMVFKFRMLMMKNDQIRDYEVPYDMTLLGFHEFITRSLGYEEGCLRSSRPAASGTSCANSR